MTAFVNFPIESFSPHAFKRFAADGNFSLDNARALMWVSQLAYQTQDIPRLTAVLDAWGVTSQTSFIRRAEATVTSGVFLERRDAVILAFAGTDPGIWETIATDIQVPLSEVTNIHLGFERAFAVAANDVETALAAAQNKLLFVAGHSLGGALAALAALFAVDRAKHRVNPTAVYTFGMPRVGGDRFCAEYAASLGDKTFRLVHGDDIVPRIPMPSLGYHHVGRVLQCEAETKFNPAASLSIIGSDEPRLPSLAVSFASHVGSALSGQLLGRPGPMGGILGDAFRALPPDIRHHLQDWYLDALT